MHRQLARRMASAALVSLGVMLAGILAAAPVAAQEQVDSHDDTRVEVQLVVLGVAVLLVVVIGSAGYLLRRKLGLVAPPPEQNGSAH